MFWVLLELMGLAQAGTLVGPVAKTTYSSSILQNPYFLLKYKMEFIILSYLFDKKECSKTIKQVPSDNYVSLKWHLCRLAYCHRYKKFSFNYYYIRTGTFIVAIIIIISKMVTYIILYPVIIFIRKISAAQTSI